MALVGAAWLVVAWVTFQVDFGVYREGARAFWESAQPYQQRFGPQGLAFTYPPFAAAFFTPFAYLPRIVAQVCWSAIALVCAGLYVWLCVCSYGALLFERLGTWLLPAVMLAFLLSDPFVRGTAYGQINAILALLIILDLLGKTGRIPQGVLIGLAAAIKLTPLFLVLYFVATRRLKAAAWSVGAFASAGALAWLIWPSASREYWGGIFLESDRVGGVGFISNQSVNGVLVRLVGMSTFEHALWLAAAAVVAVTVLLICRLIFGELPREADAIVLTAMLLTSPVSWSHHWILILPLLLVCFSRFWRDQRWVGLTLTALLSVLLVTEAIWLVPNGDGREADQNLIQALIGNSYVLVAIAVLGLLSGTCVTTVGKTKLASR